MRPDVIDAFHLPAIEHPRTSTWAYGRGEDAFEVRLPRLSPVDLKRQVDALAAARDRHLAHRPVAEIVGVIDRVAARFQDPADPLRRAAERALPAVTAYSPPMIRLVLDRMAADWRAPRLRELLRAEFGDPRVLDGFHPAPRAHGQVAAVARRAMRRVHGGRCRSAVAAVSTATTDLCRSLSHRFIVQ